MTNLILARAPSPDVLRTRQYALVTAAAVAASVAAVYVVYAAWQWSQFTVKSWDLGIFTQALQSYSRWRPPIVDIKGPGFNLLGDHFHPLLVLLAPVFAIFPHSFSLLVIQALCFGVAAGILVVVASRRLASRIMGALLGLAFGLSWGLQFAAEAQFHEIALAVPLLTGALGGILERRWWASTYCAAPLVFVKEDLGLTVAMIGLLIAYLSRERWFLWLGVWGLGWFVIATLVILPTLNATGTWVYAGSINIAALMADSQSWFDIAKVHTVFLLVVSTAGFLVGSPIALVLVPTLVWRFLSMNPGYWGPGWHYSAILMPIAFAVVIDGAKRASNARRAWLRLARYGAFGATGVAALLLPQLPLASLAAPNAWAPPTRAVAASGILKAVPAGANIESDVGLMNYIVDSHDVFWIGNTNPTPDCLLIDRIAGGTPREWGGVLSVAGRLHPSVTFSILATDAGYELACR